ncbi:MAG: hypothetical protein ACP6IS_12710 [Candidatus Asgardarchaeia archaeon]
MISAEQARQEIWQTYSSNPFGWKVYVGKDKNGFYDILVVHKDTMWIIKEFQVNPYKTIGFALKEKLDPFTKLPESRYPFGLRPINNEKVFKILSDLRNGRSAQEIIVELLSQEPTTPDEVEDKPAVAGPVVISKETPFKYLSEKQQEVNVRLKKELEKLIRRKYSYLYLDYT